MHQRRKTYYNIKKKFQRRFIGSFCFLFLLESVCIGILLYYLLNKTLSEALFVSHLKVRTTGEIIAPILLHANTSIAVIVVLAAAVFFFLSVNRIEATLHVFKNASEKVAHGNLTVTLSPHSLI
jgi:methyl-accepting chemotaxis protein